MLSFNFALSQRLKIDFNIKRRLHFVLASCFFAVLARCGRFYGVSAIILYIYACYALYRVIRSCVRFDCDVPFLGHNRFGFGAIGVSPPPTLFFIFCDFCDFCRFCGLCGFCSHKLFALEHGLSAYIVFSGNLGKRQITVPQILKNSICFAFNIVRFSVTCTAVVMHG